MYICIYIKTYTLANTNWCLCIYVYIYVYMYIYKDLHIHEHILMTREHISMLLSTVFSRTHILMTREDISMLFSTAQHQYVHSRTDNINMCSHEHVLMTREDIPMLFSTAPLLHCLPCHAYEWVMSHVWMRHITHVNEACRTYMVRDVDVSSSRVSLYIDSHYISLCMHRDRWMRHVTHMWRGCLESHRLESLYIYILLMYLYACTIYYTHMWHGCLESHYIAILIIYLYACMIYPYIYLLHTRRHTHKWANSALWQGAWIY